MNRPPYRAVDGEMVAYAAAHSSPASALLREIATATLEWTDHPDLMIDETEGKLLTLLVALSGARRVLEVGTFTGYSALCMVEAMPPDGHIDTLERSPEHAAKAVEHIAMAGESDRITVHVGVAVDSLGRLRGPYDLAFIDADKHNYPTYYDAIVPMMRPGGLVVADNVFRHGRVLDGDTSDPSVVGMREFNDKAATDPRVDAVMLTVRDGISLIRVRD